MDGFKVWLWMAHPAWLARLIAALTGRVYVLVMDKEENRPVRTFWGYRRDF